MALEDFSKFQKFKFFSQKMRFRELKLGKIMHTWRQTLIQHPSQTIAPTTIKLGMHLSYSIPYGGFSTKNRIFRKLGLWNFFATRRQSLVQHPGQTIRPITMKSGMHLPKRFMEVFSKILEIQFFFPKSAFSWIDLEPAVKVWYSTQAKPMGLQR